MGAGASASSQAEMAAGIAGREAVVRVAPQQEFLFVSSCCHATASRRVARKHEGEKNAEIVVAKRKVIRRVVRYRTVRWSCPALYAVIPRVACPA